MATGALDGLKVVEYAHFVAAPYCSKLLADLGAEVIKVEEPGQGDPARSRGPFTGDVPHPERSILYLYLNTNKRGVTLGVDSAPGRKLFRDLVAWADVLIEDNPPADMRRWGLDYKELRRVNRQLIMCSVTPFGQTGPYRDYRAYYLNTFHAGGEGYVLPGGLGWLLYHDRPPLKVGGYKGEYDCGLIAAIAVVAAYYGRELLGQGQHIDLSKQEALLTLSRPELAKWPNEQFLETRASRAFPIAGLMQCKDGFVQLMPLEEHMWRGLVDLMGNPTWARDPKYAWERLSDRMGGYAEEREQVNTWLSEWMLHHTKEEIYYGLQQRGSAAGIISTPSDLLTSEQLKGRGFFQPIEHPVAGRALYPSAPHQYSETPWRARRPAPTLGQHNEEVFCELLGRDPEDLARLRQAGVV
ncbi:MAG: CoA transferase [Chloroflexi bacterium]|nr:CoA transferase [Chloroflexota bacterium]